MTKPTLPQWLDLSQQAFTATQQWRTDHPAATMREIELAIDELLAKLRAQMVEDVALSSPLTALHTIPDDQRPLCLPCQQPLTAQGRAKRILTTKHEQSVTLQRSYATCPACGRGFFPPR
jgi:NMD protein affecting ribosome stability and mRNA decay